MTDSSITVLVRRREAIARTGAAAWGALAAWSLSGCATGIRIDPDTGAKSLAMQNIALNPRNGGLLVDGSALRAGDIILSSNLGLNSVGIRVLTQSPVSHAALYVGDAFVAEAVGEGVRRRSTAALLDEEATVVAFRHPAITPGHVAKMTQFVDAQMGSKYNYLGIMLQAPFTIERKLCELPLVPSLVRDICLQGVGAIQLGLGRNDQFFCSQFVLEAFKRGGLPLTDADPRLISPRDLLHMREGDVPSVKIHQALQYVGHLKFPSAAAPT